MADVFNIAGRIHSTSQEEVVATTNEILDETQEKKQSEVNQEVSEELALHTNRLNALTGQNYVTVVATQSTTAADIPTLINASGEGERADALYRVGFWDGSAYVADKYTEYAWKGTAYVILDVKSSIGEVFDISQYNAVGGTPTAYTNLTAALGTSGANVPSSVRRGGMSIKFIQISDNYNKYVQYRYTGISVADADFVNINNWVENGSASEQYITYWNNAYSLTMGAGNAITIIEPYISFSKSNYRISRLPSLESAVYARVYFNKDIASGETIYVYALVQKNSLTASDVDLNYGNYTIPGVNKKVSLVKTGVYLAELALIDSPSAYANMDFYMSFTAGENWYILGLRTSTEKLAYDESKLGEGFVYNSIVSSVRKSYTMGVTYGKSYDGMYRSLTSQQKFVELYPIDIIINGSSPTALYNIGVQSIKGGKLSISFISNYYDYNLINKNSVNNTCFKDSSDNYYYANNFSVQELASGVYLNCITFQNIPENTSGTFMLYYQAFHDDRIIVNVNIKYGIDGIDGVYDKDVPMILEKIKEANIELINREFCDYRLYRNIHARVYGDSIDNGGGYWEALGKKLGWMVENFAIGGSVCIWSNDVSFWPNLEINDFRIKTAWSCTLAEKESLCTAWQAATGRTIELSDEDRAVCYDNSVLTDNSDVDLFIFGDYGGNNEMTFPSANLMDDEYMLDRTTIMGAFGYVINKLMDYTNTANGSKPAAKILLMGQTNHWNNQRRTCDVIKEKVAYLWDVKFLDWYTYLSINQANLSLYSNDTLHINTTEGKALTAERIVPAIRSVQNWLLNK